MQQELFWAGLGASPDLSIVLFAELAWTACRGSRLQEQLSLVDLDVLSNPPYVLMVSETGPYLEVNLREVLDFVSGPVEKNQSVNWYCLELKGWRWRLIFGWEMVSTLDF